MKWCSGLAKQTDRMLERIIESDNPAVIAAYEKKVADLEKRASRTMPLRICSNSP